MFRKYIYKPIESLLDNDLFELSGYIAYAALLSFFPFVIILMSVATIFGAEKISATMLSQIYSLLPSEIAQQVAPVAQQIIDSHQGQALTFSTLVILWAASSGIEAIRTALNRVNGTIEQRSFYLRKLQNLFFMLLSVLGIIVIGGVMIILPVGFEYILDYCPNWLIDVCSLRNFRYPVSAVVIFITLVLMYRWLPYHGPRTMQCIPGALVAAVLWLVMARYFSMYIRDFATYNILYGSLAGIVVTLIFLHLSAFVMLYGAELNEKIRNSYSS